jgi:prepilin-type N-terminal cleavage/methylation domain-containing protein
MLKQIARHRDGMTLMELLIVVAILGLLAMVAIPKLFEAYDRSRSGVQTYSVAEASRAVENYFGTYRRYPEGLDTLTQEASSGTLYAKLNPNLAALLTTSDLSSGTPPLYTPLTNLGISHIFAHDDTGVQPSDSGQKRHHIGTGTGHDGTANLSTFAVLDTSNPTVQNILLQDFNVNPNRDSSTDAAALSNNLFVVFGLGPRNTMVGTLHQSAPLYESANPDKYYARAILVFMVPINPAPTAVTRARFLGAIAPDGRSIQDSLTDYNKGATPH